MMQMVMWFICDSFKWDAIYKVTLTSTRSTSEEWFQNRSELKPVLLNFMHQAVVCHLGVFMCMCHLIAHTNTQLVNYNTI